MNFGKLARFGSTEETLDVENKNNTEPPLSPFE